MPCRINKKRIWTHRLILESLLHDQSTFITLTYNDDHLPSNSSLVPLHPSSWMKRYRRAIYPQKIRFFLVGEYGETNGRPHYHAAIFGGHWTDPIQETWTHPKTKKPIGNIHIGDITPYSAAYLCGYVTKKWTNEDHFELKGRHPEFSRQSNRPGIGANAAKIIADTIFSPHGIAELYKTGDVPHVLKHGGKIRPLGTFLRQKIRDEIGYPDDLKHRNTYLSSLERRLQLSEAQKHDHLATAGSEIRKANRQRDLNMVNKFKIFTKERRL